MNVSHVCHIAALMPILHTTTRTTAPTARSLQSRPPGAAALHPKDQPYQSPAGRRAIRVQQVTPIAAPMLRHHLHTNLPSETTYMKTKARRGTDAIEAAIRPRVFATPQSTWSEPVLHDVSDFVPLWASYPSPRPRLLALDVGETRAR